MTKLGLLTFVALSALQAGAAGATESGAAVRALDAVLEAAAVTSVKLKVSNGSCVSKQHATWTHYLDDTDDMVLGVQTDCVFPGHEPERAENPVRFNMRNVTVHMDDGSVVVTCRDLSPCLTVDAGNNHPMAGQTVFVWSFKPLKAGHGPALVAAFAPAQEMHTQLAQDNKLIDEQIAAERLKTGFATLAPKTQR